MDLRDLGRRERKRATIAALASALAIPAFAAESTTHDEPMPRPAPQRRPAGYDAATENEACERCHAVIAEEWRGSLHHEAFDDPVFLAAYGMESQTFCRSCHVPESDPTRPATAEERHLGVGCVSCHGQGLESVGYDVAPLYRKMVEHGDVEIGEASAGTRYLAVRYKGAFVDAVPVAAPIQATWTARARCRRTSTRSAGRPDVRATAT